MNDLLAFLIMHFWEWGNFMMKLFFLLKSTKLYFCFPPDVQVHIANFACWTFTQESCIPYSKKFTLIKLHVLVNIKILALARKTIQTSEVVPLFRQVIFHRIIWHNNGFPLLKTMSYIFVLKTLLDTCTLLLIKDMSS